MRDELLVAVAVVLLAALLGFERRGRSWGVLLTKTPLSCLFILAAAIQIHPPSAFFPLVLVGLVFCLGGDVLLALPQPRAFLWGLIAFLLGHVCYVLAFFHAAQPNAWTWAGAPAAALGSGWVVRWLWPHLGPMKGPVLAYVVIITLMVAGALSVLGEGGLKPAGRILVAAGALSFYLSDLFVARERFVQSAFLNRLVGLPLYYAGQFLLAFSVGRL
jgi:uncharacterized membrane protein YhhN